MARARKFAEIKNAATGEVLVQLMSPRAEGDDLSIAMRLLTQQLIAKGHDSHGGFFGGEFGYGVDFANDVFEMHPDWQGDCTCGATDPIHSDECKAQSDAWISARNKYGIVPSTDEEIEAEIAESMRRGMSERMARLMSCGRPWSFERCDEYERLHPPPACICEAVNWQARDKHDPACRLEQHCFTYKPTGFVLDWYKYIGRDNEIRAYGSDDSLKVGQMVEHCLRSIGVESLETAAREYAEAEQQLAEQQAEATRFWMA